MFSFLISLPTGLWEWFLGDALGSITKYGWRIILFTLILKLVLSPLDFYSRYSMRKNSRKMREIKPDMDKLTEQFGHDRNLLAQKQWQLRRQAKVSMLPSCLPMLISMIIFFTLIAGFTNISAYTSMKSYITLHSTYEQYYENKEIIVEGQSSRLYGEEQLQLFMDQIKEEQLSFFLSKLDSSLSETQKQEQVDLCFTITYADLGLTSYTPTSEFSVQAFRQEAVILAKIRLAQAQVVHVFEEQEKADQKFLWVKSVWVSDVPWKSPIMSRDDFVANLNKTALIGGRVGRTYLKEYDTIIEDYDVVMGGLEQAYESKPNGYLLLIVLTVGLSFVTSLITQRQQKDMNIGNPQATSMMSSMKMMTFAMPAMLGIFALYYTSAFTIYLVSNSLYSLGLMLLINFIIRILEKRNEQKELQTVVVLRGSGVKNDKNQPKIYSKAQSRQMQIDKEKSSENKEKKK